MSKYVFYQSNLIKKVIENSRILTIIVLGAVLFLGANTIVQAQTFMVTKTADTNDNICDADCSLREAIASANATSANDIIVFDSTVFGSAQTITLTNGELIVTQPLKILGPGANLLRISGNMNSRVFFLRDTAVVTLSNLTVADGKAPVFGQTGFNNYAGGIYIEGGQLYLSQVTVTNCRAEQSAGIYNRKGILHIVNSIISNNQAMGGRNDGSYGGGIDSDGTLIIADSSIVNNLAQGGNATSSSSAGGGVGGGIRIFAGYATITNSTIANNSAIGGNAQGTGFGGNGSAAGIQVSGISTTISNTLIYNNQAKAGTSDTPSRSGLSVGGGVLSGGLVELNNVTVSNNSVNSTNSGGGISGGGGIWNSCSSCLTLTNSTVVNNTANNLPGGGAYAYSSFKLRNTIIANNNSQVGPDVSNGVLSLGNNLIGDGTGSSGLTNGVNNDRVGTNATPINPMLAPLANNGGATQTYLPLAGSLAIDNGDNCVLQSTSNGGCLVNPLITDQRGFARLYPSGGKIDIGAVEYGSSVFTPVAPVAPDLQSSSDTGVSNTDNLTNSPAPTFDITGVPGKTTVELLRNGIVVVSAYSTDGGIVSLSDAPDASGTFIYTSRIIMDGAISAASEPLSVVVDRVRPIVTIDQGGNQTDPTKNLPINFTITFSETVLGFATSDVSLAGSTADVSSATFSVSGSGANYTVAVGNIISDGQIVHASIPTGAVEDQAGNTNLTSNSTDNTVTLDNVAPRATINQASGQTDPTAVQPVNFTVVFSEPVTGFNNADISLAGSTAGVSSANIVVTGSGTTYNVAISNITSSGQVKVNVLQNAAQDMLGNVSLASTSTDNTITVVLKRALFDFDGDNKSDISVFRPSTGSWYLLQSSNNSFFGQSFGISTDVITPADFDGDSKTDFAVFRPDSGTWYLQQSTAGFTAIQFGQSGDIPVPADYDGDGRADIAVYRPSTGSWYRLNSSNGQFVGIGFGTAEDKPTIGDFDGDGKSDIAVFRPSTGGWYRLNSSNNQFVAVQFGIAEDKPTPADFDSDGKTDIAVFRPSTGGWYRLNSSNGEFVAVGFGIAEDRPVPADYDGDGKADIAVFRPSDSNWYLLRSTQGFTAVQFGSSEDLPTPNAFVP